MPKNEVIEERFTYHAPSPDQVERLSRLREKAKELAYVIDEVCPGSPDRTAAMRQLEEAIMTANKSIVLEGVGNYR